MSARVVFYVALGIYAPIYLLLARSVPRNKAGISFVSRLRVHYATTDWSVWSDWMQVFSSLGAVVLFLVDSYYMASAYIIWAIRLEVFFAVYFAFNYFFELLISKNRWAHVISLLGIVDLVTTVPVFVAIATDMSEQSPTGFVRLYRVLMLPSVFKPLRLLRAVQTRNPGQDAVMEQTIKAASYFVSTLFIASGLVQALSVGNAAEWGDLNASGLDENRMAFHDALYFIIVTFSTVGYGDISPPDTQSRLVVVVLVGFFFFMIPRELNALNRLLDLSSKYTGQYPKKLSGGHIIVGCDVSSCSLVAAFLEEFFHEDHGYNAMHVVLLVPHEPTLMWKQLALKFTANDRVTYLKGDLRSTTDLARVWAGTASACFILCNRYGNPEEEEKRGFMGAINVQDFNPNISIFVQALTVGMRQRLVMVGINPARIVCASTISTRMLANSCAWEGASTLINNLLVSASIDEQRDMPSWLKEYAFGLGKEIYVVSIGAFAGRGFSEVVMELFRQHGVVLLGISEDHAFVLHPGASYTIKKSDQGALVADDADVAESIVEQASALLAAASGKPPVPVVKCNSESSMGGAAGVSGGGGGGGSGGGKVSLPTVGMPERDDRNGSPRHQGSGLAQHDQERYRSSSQSPSRRRYRPTSSLGQGRSDDNTHIAGVTSSHGGKCQHHHHEDHGKMAAGGSHHAFRRDLHRSALRCIPTTKTPPATPFAPGLPPCSPPQLGDRADAHSHNEAQHTGCFFPQHRTISAHPNNSAVSSAGPWTRGCARQAPSSLPSSGPVRCDDRAATAARTIAENRQDKHQYDCSEATNMMGEHGAQGDDDYRRWAAHIVLVTPSLSDVSTWVEALKTSQVPDMGFVVVCPMHSWRRRRDEEDMLRLQKLPRVHLLVGSATKAVLEQAGASVARMVVVRSGKSFPEQESSDSDAETIGQLVEVFEAAGPDVRVVVELNDMTYGNQYEILVDHMHDSFAAGVPLLSQPNNNSTRCRSLSSRLLITRSNSKHNNDSDGGKGDGGKNKYKDGLKKDSAMPPLTTSRSGRHHGEAAAPSPRAVRTAEDITSTMVAGDHGTTADSSNKRRDRGKSKTSECAGSARQQPHHQQRQQQKSSSIDKHWTGVGFAFLSNLSVRRQQPRNKGSANSSGKESSIGDQRQMEPRNTSGGHTAAAAELEAKLQGAAVGRRRGMHWSLSKGFASGAVVPNNLPETLLCQAFYNPAIIKIVEALLDPTGHTPTRCRTSGDQVDDGRGLMADGVRIAKRDHGSYSGGDPGNGGGEREAAASFLAQVSPPRRFFFQAMISGNRPNFQELMRFMLDEYDALPLGLLRHGKKSKKLSETGAPIPSPPVGSPSPGEVGGADKEAPMFVHCSPPPEQKVMPLDKVFLLAPSHESWERMCLDSPARSLTPNSSQQPRQYATTSPGQSRSRDKTSTHLPRSPQHRCSSPVWAGGGDGHGDGGKGGDGGGDSPQQIFGAEFSRDRSTECSRENSSIFIRRRDDHNPFTISVREEGLGDGDGDGVEVTLGGGGGYLAEGTARERYANIGNPPSPFAVPADVRERGSDSGNHASPPRPPAFLASSPRGKGRHTSHAKLDLLLTEVQHISGRLSGIASRLDALERTGQKDRGDELSLGESGPDGGGAGTSMEIEASAGSRSSRSADLVSKKDGVPDAFQTVV